MGLGSRFSGIGRSACIQGSSEPFQVILTPLPTFCTVGAHINTDNTHIHAHTNTRANTHTCEFDAVAHGLFNKTRGCALPTPVIHVQSNQDRTA